MTIGTGFISIASPCVLPIIPIIVSGTEEDHKLKPLLIVFGLSLTFIIMGIISSAFGSLITGHMRLIERIAGVIMIIFGILMIADRNIFKSITFFNRFSVQPKGKWSGFAIGATLGLIWIPCIGPLLSSVLAMVASKGTIAGGIFFLTLYSIGFSIPILLAGYFSHFFRKHIGSVQKRGIFIRVVSGVILIAFGVYIISKGLVGLNF